VKTLVVRGKESNAVMVDRALHGNDGDAMYRSGSSGGTVDLFCNMKSSIYPNINTLIPRERYNGHTSLMASDARGPVV
jgi:hypothetical protein